MACPPEVVAFCGDHDSCVDTNHDLAAVLLPERVDFHRTGNFDAVPLEPFRTSDDHVSARLAGYGCANLNPLLCGDASDFERYRNVRLGDFDFSDSPRDGPLWVRPGDSGAPVITGDPDDPDPHAPWRIIGTLSGTAITESDGANFNDPQRGPHIDPVTNWEWLQRITNGFWEVISTLAPGNHYWVWGGGWGAPPRGDPARERIDGIDDLDPDGDGLFGQALGPDGTMHDKDNCPLIANADQRDDEMGKGDGIGDAVVTCTPTAAGALPIQVGCEAKDTNGDGTIDVVAATDTDHDGVFDACDNCIGGLITTSELGSTLTAHLRTGFRFCPCGVAVPGERLVDSRCGTSTEAGGGGCVVDEGQYAPSPGDPSTNWRPMHLQFFESHGLDRRRRSTCPTGRRTRTVARVRRPTRRPGTSRPTPPTRSHATPPATCSCRARSGTRRGNTWTAAPPARVLRPRTPIIGTWAATTSSISSHRSAPLSWPPRRPRTAWRRPCRPSSAPSRLAPRAPTRSRCRSSR